MLRSRRTVCMQQTKDVLWWRQLVSGFGLSTWTSWPLSLLTGEQVINVYQAWLYHVVHLKLGVRLKLGVHWLDCDTLSIWSIDCIWNSPQYKSSQKESNRLTRHLEAGFCSETPHLACFHQLVWVKAVWVGRSEGGAVGQAQWSAEATFQMQTWL